ncbi:MAG: SurA N-terminal domain-containing protein, partial [Planctomycetota bacterium]|nr:SurA N-terminal domain-containing protein [Planctomycetota bacterium]
MRRALLVLWLWLGGAVLGAGEELGRVVDQPLRFVNGRVITIGDLRWRNGMRVESYRRAGRPLPETRAALLAFHRESLEELTDEELLLQQAEELGVSIDREQLASDVRSEARERGLDIRQLAQLKRWREREAKLRVVVNWVEGRAPAVAPQQLALAYQQRRQEFARPARARVRLLALRPASDDERRELRRQLANLMRDVQQSPEEPLAALARSRLEEFLAADVEGQQSILLAFAQAVAASESVQREGRALVERARELLARAQSALGEAECRACLLYTS